VAQSKKLDLYIFIQSKVMAIIFSIRNHGSWHTAPIEWIFFFFLSIL
jgi:hypothetical protein